MGLSKVLFEEPFYRDSRTKESWFVPEQVARFSSPGVDPGPTSPKGNRDNWSCIFEWIDLAEVVQNAVRKTKFKAKEIGLELCVQIPDDLPAVRADGVRMEQILMEMEKIVQEVKQHADDGL